MSWECKSDLDVYYLISPEKVAIVAATLIQGHGIRTADSLQCAIADAESMIAIAANRGHRHIHGLEPENSRQDG